MNRRDVAIGVVILALLGGAIYYFQKQPQEELQVPEPETLSLEGVLEERFGLQIPDDVERTELSDITGGNTTGIATRKFADGKFEHMVLVDLPDPEEGSFYEGWLVRGADVISTGVMRLAKGGYLLEFESSIDYSDYNQVVITLEEVIDSSPEEHVLEGTF